MDSKKVGQGIPAALTSNAPVQKNRKVSKEGDGTAPRAREEKVDYNVALSDRSKEIAESRLKALEIARNTPDIQENKVAELKKRIEAGEYKVDAGQIADGMLREAIRDELAKTPADG